jgi:branched-chain amino acid transport system substrate-binding protein
MDSQCEMSRLGRRRARHAVRCAVAGALLVSVSACGDGGEGNSAADQPAGAGSVSADLLGPEDQASGEPVRIGMVSDGSTPTLDNTDELRAAGATADYWNTHKGGVGGRPVEVVTCETGADPAGATDCANQMVEQEVAAVTLSQSGVAASVWEPLRAAGVPTFWLQSGGDVAADDQSSFTMYNPQLTLFGVPLSVAENVDADTIAFVVIDVPQATETLEADVERFAGAAGLEYEIVTIPPGTPDMTSRMQDVVASGADVVQVVGNDAFCIAAFNGLDAVGYEGEITSITQCITDTTREAVAADVLEGISITATIALGATDDPTVQLYEAVIDAYGDDVRDVDNATSMGGYVAMASLLTALDGLSGEITHRTVIDAITAMPEADIPGGGGMTFQCGGSASPEQPAVCTNQSLRTTLDADGRSVGYEVVDSTEIVSGSE